MAPLDSFTKLMLHCNGADTSTTFTDDSDTPHTVTASGIAQLDTAEKKFGSASGIFNGGASDYLDIPDHADFSMGSGDFTLDFWFKRNLSATTVGQILILKGDFLTIATSSFFVELNHGSTIRFGVYDPTNFAGATITNEPGDTLWHHLAAVRDGNTNRIFLDGIEGNSVDVTGWVINDTSWNMGIGHRSGGAGGGATPFKGHIEEIRISKGIARWTTNFTPPTVEYGASPGGVIIPRRRMDD